MENPFRFDSSFFHQHQNPFQVPSDYFEDLPMRVQGRLQNQPSPSVASRLFHALRPQFAMVGMMVGLYLVVFLGFKGYNEFSLSGNSLSKEVQQMQDLEQSGIDEEMIIQYMVTDSAVQTAHDLKSNEIIDYLVNSGIEFETIADEL